MGFGDAVASAGPYANKLHLAPDRLPHQHLITQFFTGRMLFLTPNQQCQSTEGTYTAVLFSLLFLHSNSSDTHTHPVSGSWNWMVYGRRSVRT